MKNQKLDVQLKAVHDAVLYSEDHTLYGSLSMTPPDFEEADRPALNISIALDVSGSMCGPKLEAAKVSLLKLVEHLSDKDLLSLTVFGSMVDTVVTHMSLTAENKVRASAAIKGIQVLGCTNLSGGLLAALKLLKESPSTFDGVKKCLIFTDGLANEGIVDGGVLARTVMDFAEKIQISSFGYGSDHNDKMLTEIAQGGSFYYIKTPDEIIKAFSVELGGLISTYAQNVKITLSPKKGVKILNVLNDFKTTEVDGNWEIVCDNLLAGQRAFIGFEFKVDKKAKAFPRKSTIVKANIEYFSLIEKKFLTQEISLKLRFSKDASTKEDKSVLEDIAVLKIANAHNSAQFFADKGMLKEAQGVLLAASDFAQKINTAFSGKLANSNNKLINTAYFSQEVYASTGSKTSRSVGSSLRTGRGISDEWYVASKNTDPNSK